jgi:hypothetical protein
MDTPKHRPGWDQLGKGRYLVEAFIDEKTCRE